MPAAGAPHTLLIGVGNPLRGDDGVGPWVAAAVRAVAPEAAIAVVAGGAAELIDAWDGESDVLVVDASAGGGPPGTVRRYDATRRPVPADFERHSSHGLGLAEAIELGRALGRLPARLRVVTVEGARFEHGARLSPEVLQAARSLVEEVAPAPARLRVEVRGAVQGVGFRPFVYRLASELGLAGWVLNDARGVDLEVEGSRELLELFLARLERQAPPRAVVHAVRPKWLAPTGLSGFHIRESAGEGAKTAAILPDIALCDACLAEIRDPADRRHRYPFTNCTHCGPRFSILHALPYDRANTTMARFALCADCRREYTDPGDRRFHAQPNACPACGPATVLLDAEGWLLARRDRAIRWAVAALRSGRIVAVKGLGGYHLVVDATNAAAVEELRRRKGRWGKPLAVMVPDVAAAERLCEIPEAARDALLSPEAPILLLRRRPRAAIVEGVAPDNPCLGLMLPYTPLHRLLLDELDRPVVATSGNRSDEPIAFDDREARERLGGIADLLLAHDRPIERPVDDSVAWLTGGTVRLLRRARGWAPLPVRLGVEVPTLLAVGAHLKNTVALGRGRDVFVSQHIGDMESPEAGASFEARVADFLRLWDARPVAVAHDLHPDYRTTRWAIDAVAGRGRPELAAALQGLPLVGVQHHHAHLAACLADAGRPGPALGFTWDGTGYGPDGTVWGGEVLVGDAAGYERVARLRPFRLPGGEAAIRDPRRTALALLWQIDGESCFERPPGDHLLPRERSVLPRMIASGIGSPWTSSAGRLFDAVAALAGVALLSRFEGQAAMALEFAADPAEAGSYPIELVESPAESPGTSPPPLELDWREAIAAIALDLERGLPAATVAARFHNALVDAMLAVARRVGSPTVALTGGCFQNRRLLESGVERLRAAGFEILQHRQVPPNDGGIAFGQIVIAAARIREGS